jgi:PKD repeat protein
VPIQNGAIAITQPPHSVRILKLVDSSIPEAAPAFAAHAPASARAGESVAFSASPGDAESPVLRYRWAFGDGVSADGAQVSHAYTHAGQYTATVTASGLNGRTLQHTLGISVTGSVPTIYNPSAKARYRAPK